MTKRKVRFRRTFKTFNLKLCALLPKCSRYLLAVLIQEVVARWEVTRATAYSDADSAGTNHLNIAH